MEGDNDVLARVKIIKGVYANNVGDLLSTTNGNRMEVNTWEEVLAFPPGRKHPYRDVHIKLAGM